MRFLVFFLLLLVAVCTVQAQRYPAFIPCYKDGKWGYCDSNGKWLIKPQWDAVQLFTGNTAIVYHRVIDSSRRSPVLKYDYPSLINRRDKYIIPPSRRWTGVKSIWDLNARDQQTGKWGIIDSNNKVVVPLLYDNRADGTTRVYHKTRKVFYFLGRRDGLWGLIDEKQRTVIPFKYHKLEMADTAHLVFKTYLHGKNGAISIDGKTILPTEYTDLRFGWGTWAGGRDGKWGAFDSSGRMIVPFVYNTVLPGLDSIVAYDGSVFIYFDKKGKQHRTSKVRSYSHVYQTGDRPYWPPPSDYKELVDPGAGMLRRGERIYSALINGRKYGLSKLMEFYPGNLAEELYVANLDRNYYHGETSGHIIIVDTALTQRGATFYGPYVISVMDKYILGYSTDGYALYDTNANRLTKPVKISALMGYIEQPNAKRAEDSILLIAAKYNEYYPGYYNNPRPHIYNPDVRKESRDQLTGDVILNAAGDTVQIGRYKRPRYIPARHSKLLGRSDIVFVKNEQGYEGIISVRGETIFPAVSFKYKWMGMVGEESNWGFVNISGGNPDHGAIANRPLLPLPGSFVVKDDSGRLGYFDTKGRALNPAFQFVYKEEARKMGNDLYWLPNDLAYWERDGYRGLIKLVNGKNEDLTPGKKVTYIKLLPQWPGLYQIFLQTPDKRNDLNFYISEAGCIYGEGRMEP